MDFKLLIILTLLITFISHRSNISINLNKILSSILLSTSTSSSTSRKSLTSTSQKSSISFLSYFQPINNLKIKPQNKLNIPTMTPSILNKYLTRSKHRQTPPTPPTPTTTPTPPTPEEILESLQQFILTTPLTSKNLPQIIKHLMEEVEKTTLIGQKKKNLALYIFKKTLTDLPEGEDAIVLLILIDNGTVDNLINVISSASKGKYKINTLHNQQPTLNKSSCGHCDFGKTPYKSSNNDYVTPSFIQKLGCVPSFNKTTQ